MAVDVTMLLCSIEQFEGHFDIVHFVVVHFFIFHFDIVHFDIVHFDMFISVSAHLFIKSQFCK